MQAIREHEKTGTEGGFMDLKHEALREVGVGQSGFSVAILGTRVGPAGTTRHDHVLNHFE